MVKQFKDNRAIQQIAEQKKLEEQKHRKQWEETQQEIAKVQLQMRIKAQKVLLDAAKNETTEKNNQIQSEEIDRFNTAIEKENVSKVTTVSGNILCQISHITNLLENLKSDLSNVRQNKTTQPSEVFQCCQTF